MIEQVFSVQSMRLAWERYIRLTSKNDKDYFGITLYERNLDSNLDKLSTEIVNKSFEVKKPLKYFTPKSSGLKGPSAFTPKSAGLTEPSTFMPA